MTAKIVSSAEGMALLVAVLVAPLLYAHGVYPVLLAARTRRPGPPERRSNGPPPPGDAALPSVDAVCVFHDEGDAIFEKARDLLAQDYPAGRLRVLLVSDGSTDGADERLDAAGLPGVEVLRLPRAGKSAALAEALRRCAGDVVVLSDANVRMDPGSLRALASAFSDPGVGAAVPVLVAEGSPSEALYARFEDRLRRLESEAGTTVAPTGACLAVRRGLLDDSFFGMLCEDLWIGLRVLASGRRIVRAGGAVVRERAGRERDEYARRVRIGEGNAQVIRRLGEVWDRLPLFARFAFASHKLVRWAAPFPLAAGLLLGAAGLAGRLGAPAVLLAAAAAAACPPVRYAAAMHLALGAGILRGLARPPCPAWTPRRA